jgi:hypothetical protein
MPDRPGALGQVASRIGAVRGDVIGIDILERGGGKVIDELVVSVPDDSVVDLLVAEISQVDGVAVEDVQRVRPERPEPGLATLDLAALVAEAPAASRLATLCDGLAGLLDADWVMAVEFDRRVPLHVVGDAPDAGWLTAFVDGSRHLDSDESFEAAPSDLAWGAIESIDVVVAVGRSARPLHMRERRQLVRLCRLASALLVAAPV